MATTALWSVRFNPGLSVREQFMKKANILRSYVRRQATEFGMVLAARKSLRGLQGIKSERQALIIANGHSALKLSPEKVRLAQEDFLDVFAMNSYLIAKSPIAISPDYYVLSDPAHLPSSQLPDTVSLWNRLYELNGVTLVAAHTFVPELEKFPAQKIFFNDLGLEGFGRNIDPRWPRSYLSRTAHKALAVAVFMGYSRVHVIGLDNSSFKDYVSTADGKVLYGGNTHFWGGSAEWVDESREYVQGISDVLLDYSLVFLDLKRLFGGRNIVNLDVESITDAFPKFSDVRLL